MGFSFEFGWEKTTESEGVGCVPRYIVESLESSGHKKQTNRENRFGFGLVWFKETTAMTGYGF